MKLLSNWRQRLNILIAALIIVTVFFVAFTLLQWIRSEPGSYEPLNVLAATMLSVFTAFSAWLSRDIDKSTTSANISLHTETFDLGTLRKQIATHLDLNELRTLCFDLAIDFDEIEGDTKTTKIVSILDYVQRHNQLTNLLNYLEQIRPNLNWQSISRFSLTEINNRTNFLRNVQATWIDGYLQKSLPGSSNLELRKTLEFDSVARNTPFVLGQTEQVLTRPLIEIFHEYGNTLLILGEPGGGKTITLLKLASDLLENAQADLNHPMPVVLNLSSWGQERKAFSDWLVDEILLQYQVARNLARTWLQSGQLLFLLDGLDEVSETYRDSCVDAINVFRSQYASDLVVCSRVDNYRQLKNRLNVACAIRIHPLSKSQISEYLTEQGITTKVVRISLQSDPDLLELARSPLFLRIMTLAYQGLSYDELKPLASIESRRHHLLNHYVNAVFTRRPLDSNHTYNKDDALMWLANLASQMLAHNQTIFRFENLQPSWLRQNYVSSFQILVGLIVGIIGGLWSGLIFLIISALLGRFPFGLIMGLVFCVSGGLSIALSQRLVMSHTVPLGRTIRASFSSWLIFGLIFSLFNLLSIGLTFLISDALSVESSQNMFNTLREHLQFVLQGGFDNWLVFVLVFGVTDSLSNWLIYSISSGLVLGLSIGLNGGLAAYQTNINLVELIVFSKPTRQRLWNTFVKGLVSGLISGLSIGLVFGWSIGLSGWLDGGIRTGILFGVRTGIAFGLVFSLLGIAISSIKSRQTEKHVQPNEGVRNSLINALRMTLLLNSIAIFAGWMIDKLFVGDGLFLYWLLSVSLPFTLLYFGGLSTIQHYTLRWLLFRQGTLPYSFSDKHLTHFYDSMTDRIVLQRVGNGWIFIHRTLLEYFAKYLSEEQT